MAPPLGCSSATSHAQCDELFVSGGIEDPRMPLGYKIPCTWHDSACTAGKPLACATLDAWHGCPAKVDLTWSVMYGFRPSASHRWMCAADGTFTSVGSSEQNDVKGLTRAEAMQMEEDACKNFPWHGTDSVWRPKEASPAIFGLDTDVRAALRYRPNATMLSMSMRRKRQTSSGQLPSWTPCANLAFTLCAARGRLGNRATWNGVLRGGRLYLATRGADVLTRCNPNVAVPNLDSAFTWDECYVTKSEFCTLSRECSNGREVWNTTGHWTCRHRASTPNMMGTPP